MPLDPQRSVCHRVHCEGVPCAKGDGMAFKLSMHRKRTGNNSLRKPDTTKTSLSGRIGVGNPERSRTQLQVDGKMKVCSVGPRFTEHDDEPIDEEDIARFHDDVTGNLLPGHLVRAARQEKIKFLKTFPVYKKVPGRTQKVRNASWSVGASCGTNLGGKIRSSRARSRPLHPWTASVSFIGFRLVDDDMGGNWTSSCSY